MKTKEEPNELKMPVELADEELDSVVGGIYVGGYEYVDADGVKRKTSSLKPRIVEVD